VPGRAGGGLPYSESIDLRDMVGGAMIVKQERLLPEMKITELETEAIAFLQEKAGQSSNIGLAFSGGKDSVVIMELMVGN